MSYQLRIISLGVFSINIAIFIDGYKEYEEAMLIILSYMILNK